MNAYKLIKKHKADEIARRYNTVVMNPPLPVMQVVEVKTRAICMRCGSDNLVRDADVEWNVAKQEWQLTKVRDSTTCDICRCKSFIWQEL